MSAIVAVDGIAWAMRAVMSERNDSSPIEKQRTEIGSGTCQWLP
jgi:hypothetical protein